MKEQAAKRQSSRELLFIGLCHLLETQTLTEISISGLCKAAGVGRSTFYRYYKIPENVLVDKFKYEIQRMITTNVSEGNNEKKRIYAIILETCLFADKYPVILFANLKTPTMMQNVITRAIEGLNFTFNRKGMHFNYQDQVFLAGGVNGALTQWYKNRRQEPVENLAMRRTHYCYRFLFGQDLDFPL